MSEFSVNPDYAQLLKEDDNAYEIFHPNLGKFQVAKAALSAETHGFIKNLQPVKMADGGITPPAEPVMSSAPATDSPIPDESTFVRSPMEAGQAAAIDAPGFGLNELQRAYNQELKAKKLAEGNARDEFGVPMNVGLPNADEIVDPKTPPTSVDQDALQKAKLTVDARNSTAQEAANAVEASQAAKQQSFSELGFAPPEEKPEQPQNAAPSIQPPDTGVAAVNGQGVPVKKEKPATDPMVSYIAGLKKIDADAKDYELQSLEEINKIKESYQSGRASPYKAWSLPDIGNKVLSAISIALGGISQGILKTPSNPALDVINKAIDRQLEQDKLSFEREEKAIGRVTERKKDMREYLHQKKMEYFESVKTMAEATNQKFKNAESAANLDKLKAETGAIQMKNIKEYSMQRALEGSGGGPGSGVFTPQQAQAISQDKEQSGRLVRLPDGNYVQGVGAESAITKSNETLTAVYDAKKALEKVRSLSQKTGFNTDANWVPGSDAKKRAEEGEVALEDLKVKLRKAQGISANKELKGIDARLKSTEAFDSAAAQAGYSAVENSLNDTADSELFQVAPGYKPKGKPKTFKPGLAKK